MEIGVVERNNNNNMIQHLHAETKVLPLLNDLNLHASNFLQKPYIQLIPFTISPSIPQDQEK